LFKAVSLSLLDCQVLLECQPRGCCPLQLLLELGNSLRQLSQMAQLLLFMVQGLLELSVRGEVLVVFMLHGRLLVHHALVDARLPTLELCNSRLVACLLLGQLLLR
jgi:hypothetical protein